MKLNVIRTAGKIDVLDLPDDFPVRVLDACCHVYCDRNGTTVMVKRTLMDSICDVVLYHCYVDHLLLLGTPLTVADLDAMTTGQLSELCEYYDYDDSVNVSEYLYCRGIVDPNVRHRTLRRRPLIVRSSCIDHVTDLSGSFKSITLIFDDVSHVAKMLRLIKQLKSKEVKIVFGDVPWTDSIKGAVTKTVASCFPDATIL